MRRGGGCRAEVKFMKFTTWRLFCELPCSGWFRTRSGGRDRRRMTSSRAI